jgi:hypothetical protein
MTKKYERKCEDWLYTFSQWCLPRSEAKESYILWTGLFTLAAALRRHVKVPKSIFGSWEASPNLYVIFVAPPGKARKSTTANYAEDLLDELGITRAPTIVTQAALLQQLVNSSDSSIYIMSAEFGSFIKKSGVEMFEFLTDIFDGRKNIEASTIMRGSEFAERPCVNLLAATTPKWIAENMPESVIGGGFASRVIFIYEEGVRRRQLYYRELDHGYLGKLKEALVEDLKHIAGDIQGDLDITEDGEAFMQNWYKENADKEHNPKLSGYYERKPAHIHKIATLLHFARSDTMWLEKKDLEHALRLLEIAEPKLHKIFDPIGKNVYAPDLTVILQFIIDKKGCTAKELKREFYAIATPNMLDEIITGMVQAGFIKMIPMREGDNIVEYKYVAIE